MSERMQFVARLQQGERMSDLCSEFGISRKTGYKIQKRYAAAGPMGLYDQSRRPHRSPRRTPRVIASEIEALRTRHPTWGPKKLRQRLMDLQPEVRWPAASTIGVILKDAGLVDGRKRRRRASPTSAPRRASTAANELWCIDFKGQFRLSNGRYCYPLTVSDHFSRYLVGCEAMTDTKADPAAHALEGMFRAYGLPDAMRSDNGSPFASTGRGGLTTLSVWLMRLGIRLERIDPGHPEQNSRHERMHRTLKADATRPPGANLLQQQERLDTFRTTYNQERPHESLDMKPPAKLYSPSQRKLPPALPPVRYPLHDLESTIDCRGFVRLPGHRPTYLTSALVGQTVGLRELDTGTWLVTFMDLDLGYLDQEVNRVFEMTPTSGSQV